MLVRNTLLVALIVTGTPAVSQSYGELAYFRVEIGPEDMRNSRGTPLTTLGAVIQQDRANFHRFGIQHRGDDSDPVFSNRANRALIPELYREGGRIPSLERKLRTGRSFRFSIFVCGYGDRPTTIYLAPPNSDHSGCF